MENKKNSALSPSEKAVIRLQALGASILEQDGSPEVWLPQGAPAVALLECGLLLARMGPGRLAGLEALRLETKPRLRAKVDAAGPAEILAGVLECRKLALARLAAFAEAEQIEPDPAQEWGVGVRVAVATGLPAERLVVAGYLIAHAADFAPEPGEPLSVQEDERRLVIEIRPRGLTRRQIDESEAGRLRRRYDECFPGWGDKLQLIDELTAEGRMDLVIDHRLEPLRKVEFGFRLARLTEFAYPFGFDGPDAPVRLHKWYPHGLRFRVLSSSASAAGVLKESLKPEHDSRSRIVSAFGELVTLKAGVHRAGNSFYVDCGDAWVHAERHIAHVWTGFLLAQLFEGPYEELRIEPGNRLTFALPITHLSDLDMA